MIQLVRLNLLPYREIAKDIKKKTIQEPVVVCLLTISLVIILNFFLDSRLSVQQKRNMYLQSNIKAMQFDLKEFKKLQKEKEKLLSQKNQLEGLQTLRIQIARMMDELDQIVPKGVQLMSIEPSKENQYIIYGKALTDKRVALFLKAMSTHDLFEKDLVMNEIKTKNGKQEFKITVTLKNFSKNHKKKIY